MPSLSINVGSFSLGQRDWAIFKTYAPYTVDICQWVDDGIDVESRYLFQETCGTSANIGSKFITYPLIDEEIRILDQLIISIKESILENFQFDDDFSFKLKIFLSDIVRCLENLSSTGIFGDTIATNIFFQEIIIKHIIEILSETIGIEAVLSLIYGVFILDNFSILSEQESSAEYHLQLLQLVRINPILQNYWGLFLYDTFNLADASSSQFITYPLIEESLSLAETLGHSLLFRVTFAETITLSDDDIIRQIITGLLTDDFEIIAGYVAPNGTFTTWNINTRSGATTEYQNFNFNSFTKISHKYLGASSTGLYELNGDDDDGTTIISTITSGLMQVAGSKFTSFKAAYLGLRGKGEYLLKLVSGEGQEYIYKVHAETMKSARVNFGKGLRSRYFSYQLQNVDQDFDLDAIEFLPIGANRRV